MSTFLTRWGRLTGPEWIRRRFDEASRKWFPPEVLHHAFLRLPYHDSNGQKIVDLDFIRLLSDDPAAAHQQLEHECTDYLNHLAICDRRRAEQQALQHQHTTATQHPLF